MFCRSLCSARRGSLSVASRSSGRNASGKIDSSRAIAAANSAEFTPGTVCAALAAVISANASENE